jgi:ADP-ribosyltransferase exoenzyme
MQQGYYYSGFPQGYSYNGYTTPYWNGQSTPIHPIIYAPVTGMNTTKFRQPIQHAHVLPFQRTTAKKEEFSYLEAGKHILKGLVSPITGMFSSTGNFIKGAAMIAGGAALLAVTGGAAAPFLLALGAGIGGIQAAKGTYDLAIADSTEKKYQALEELGAATSTLGLSVLGAKPALNAAGVCETKNLTTIQAVGRNMAESPESFMKCVDAFTNGDAAKIVRTRFASKSAPLEQTLRPTSREVVQEPRIATGIAEPIEPPRPVTPVSTSYKPNPQRYHDGLDHNEEIALQQERELLTPTLSRLNTLHSEIYQRLSEQQRQVVAKYQDLSGINDALRGKLDPEDYPKSLACQPVDEWPRVKAMDQIIQQAELPEPITLYRGISNNLSNAQCLAFEDFLPHGRFAELFTDLGYGSASVSKIYVAHNFTDSLGYQGFMLKINAPKGTNVLNVDAVWNNGIFQNEFVLPRNSAFKVKGVDTKQRLVELDLIHTPKPVAME